MLIDEIWDFKSVNMGRELEIAGEFIYDSAKRAMAMTGVNNQYEINAVLYNGAAGIERVQKIYLCLVQRNPTDANSMPRSLMQHNHLELEKEISKYSLELVSGNGRGLLGTFADYYKNYRYRNYIPGKCVNDLKKLFISFLRKQNRKFNFDEPCAVAQFKVFVRFYINELGKLSSHYFKLIEDTAREKSIYTYEINSFSNAARVFFSTSEKTLYEQMVIEQNAVKELLLYIYKNKSDSGVFRLLNDMDSLELDHALINDYLADLYEGKVNDFLIDCVNNFYEEIEDKAERKKRKELLSLIGNRDVLFDYDVSEDNDEDEA